MTFDEMLRVAMALAKITQTDLAKAAGVDQSVISRLANGDRQPTLATAQKLAVVLPQLRYMDAKPSSKLHTNPMSHGANLTSSGNDLPLAS